MLRDRPTRCRVTHPRLIAKTCRLAAIATAARVDVCRVLSVTKFTQGSGNPPERKAFSRHADQRRTAVPVFILWAIPAVIVLGGGAYWIAHIH